MSNKGSSSVISLPTGGGALHGIGEKFSPDLHTGTGNFTVPIAIPPGRSGFQPQLNLVYSTGNGNGLFGLGWSLSIPGVNRKTSKGVPCYDDEKDTFILSGAEDLVQVGLPSTMQTDTAITTRWRYQPRTEGLFARIEHFRVVHKAISNQSAWVEDYWEVRSKDGLVSYYGTPSRPNPDQSDPAILAKPDDPTCIFAWKLTHTEDPFGNRIEYEYEADYGNDGSHHWNQPRLKQIRYADYLDSQGKTDFLVTATFNYETRPDASSEYRAGFEIRTTQRCSEIIIETHADANRTVRTYRFLYQGDTLNGVSLLNQIKVIGHDADKSQELPPLEFDYTRFEPQRRNLMSLQGKDLPSRSLANPDTELVDLFGNGLPDILEMNGTVRYWRNLGSGRFDLPRPMRDAPPYSLADSGVQIIDANGNGLSDLLVTTDRLAGYYPMRFGGLWDRRSFHPYQAAPSFNLKDPEVKLVDLDGDGVTDVIRSGSRLECFFNDPHDGWKSNNTKWVERRTLTDFPNINFSDSRVKWADMSGDGLQDIVLVYDGNIEYWPNLGRGNWGARVSMRHCPRFPYGYDPKRILIGDVDGDGLADLVYIDDTKATLWINQSGNSWSEPIEILGTPPVSDMDAIRLVDLLGTGVSGILWSAEANGLPRARMFFLDFTGGIKPYLLHEMNNHMGAVTQVEYAPSTKFYLVDEKRPQTRWKTPLPFPVQVVARVEVIDQISQGKLTTEYRYHHGYWDGAEREFRGFGFVEQLDTETFEDYNAPGLHGEAASFARVADRKHFSPPTLTKTWFHQGPVGDEFGEWEETDFGGEFWRGDPQVLSRPASMTSFLGGLPRRVKRDALRTLRGSILRTELYAQDGTPQQDRPYTVTESLFGVREESKPEEADDDRLRIFFPHALAQRTTQWERGDDPMMQFTFTEDYDLYGQPCSQISIAVPRGRDYRVATTLSQKYLATHTVTEYAQRDDDQRYIVDRVAHTMTFEVPNDGSDDLFTLKTKIQGKTFDTGQNIIGQTLNFYDRDTSQPDNGAFLGLPLGQIGEYGALVRTETLVLTDDILLNVYGSERPPYLNPNGVVWPDEYPLEFRTRLPSLAGYDTQVSGAVSEHAAGYFATTERRCYDFHDDPNGKGRGLTKAKRDPLGHDTSIQYDDYALLPVEVIDAAQLTTKAEYDYRVMQPRQVTDPNENRTKYTFTPLGLLESIWIQGKESESVGDLARPSTRFEYNFAAYVQFTIPLSLQSDLDNGSLSNDLRQEFQHQGVTLTANATVQVLDPGKAWLIRDDRQTFMLGVEDQQIAVTAEPISVHTIRHVDHDSETDAPSADTIETFEYSDGFGRLIQTRTQAEDVTFGNKHFGGGILSPDQTHPQDDAQDVVGKSRAATDPPNAVVSGWQVYDNKGRVVEKYEPFFSTGWEYKPPTDEQLGQKATMFYDPRGHVIRTVNPDGSEQRVIYGVPGSIALPDLTNPDRFEPTPWEAYTYDANDNAGRTHPAEAVHYQQQWNTPSSAVVDALGRTVIAVERNRRKGLDGVWSAIEEYRTRSEYDIRGNLLTMTDALGRVAFKHIYDLANKPLRIESIDAGVRRIVLDANGNEVERRDSKGALILHAYDELNRPIRLWARDKTGETITLREHLIYGDSPDAGLTREQAQAANLLGKLYKHYEEAGLLTFEQYDFKGNVREKARRVIKDDQILSAFASAASNNWQVPAYRVDWQPPNGGTLDTLTAALLDAVAYQTSITYDALNRVRAMRYPQDVDNAHKMLFPHYNRAGALESVTLDGATYVEHIAYNAKGQRTLIAYGNNVMTRYAYDEKTFRLARLRTEHYTKPSSFTYHPTGAPLQDFAYEYDLAGNITAIHDRTPESGTPPQPDQLDRSFDYDPLYRLIQATGRECDAPPPSPPWVDNPRCTDLTRCRSYTQSYTYDAVGNMTQMRHSSNGDGFTRDFSPHAENNRLATLTIGTTTPYAYTYDDNGNLVQENSSRHLEWDHSDHMRVFRTQTEGAQPSIHTHYLYDATGQRVKKLVRKQGGSFEVTVYVDGVFEHHRLVKLSESKENNTLHVMDNQSRIAMIRVGAAFPDGGTPEHPVKYHLGDHLGSSNVVVSDEGTWINREEYTPYGETSFGSFARKRYRFTGKERDEESGLYYHGDRYYAGWLARWTSVDPQIALNCFQYARGNPVRFSDPNGRVERDEVNVSSLDEINRYIEKKYVDSLSEEALKEKLRLMDIRETYHEERGYWPETPFYEKAKIHLQQWGRRLKEKFSGAQDLVSEENAGNIGAEVISTDLGAVQRAQLRRLGTAAQFYETPEHFGRELGEIAHEGVKELAVQVLVGGTLKIGGSLLRLGAEAGVAEYIEGRTFIAAHGTTAEFAEKIIETQGKVLSKAGGSFGGRFFLALDAQVADIFAARTAGKLGGQKGIVGLALPEEVFSKLKREGKVIINRMTDLAAQQVIFEPGALETLQKEGYFFRIKPEP